jgi:hypothetical protein
MEDSGTKRLKDKHAALIYIHGRIGYQGILIKFDLISVNGTRVHNWECRIGVR